MSLDRSNKFSCIVMGSGTLPIRCAEILLGGGHEICAIVSSYGAVKNWAKAKNIPLLVPGANLAEQITRPFDYLFSIVNEHILREDVLQLPRKLAINYHDAPLPRYAGTHATSWALINGERSHGISWHVITDVVDAGDILKQRSVEIAVDDTALTLNTKCYEAAIHAFGELVEDLSKGNAIATQQNLEERTFFARFKRPANGCVISWSSPAAEISALVRALNFGGHPNPLGKAKLAVGNDFFIVPELELLDSPSKSAPGTITKIGPDFIQLDTADREIVLRRVLQLDGQPVAVRDLVAKFHLHEGCRFAELDPDMAQRIDELNKAICKHEAFWFKKLSALVPAVPPYSNTISSSGETRSVEMPMQIPDEVLASLKLLNSGLKPEEILLAVFGALLSRLGGVNVFDIGYANSALRNETDGLEKLFANQLPMRFEIDGQHNFTHLCGVVEEQLELVKKRKTYATDIVTRYSELSPASGSDVKFTLPVAAETVKKFEDYQPNGNDLTLLIAENATECRWLYNSEKIKEESIEKLIRHFTTILKGIVADPESQIAYLPLLTEEERHRLLVEWNDNRVDYPKNVCIHQLFEEQAARTPDAVALISDETQLTYQELNSRSNQLAHYLRARGVGPEVFVGICVERSVETIIAILGILKAGGAYLPLDPAYPSERIKFVLSDASLKFVLTQQRLRHKVENHCEHVICIDTEWNLIARENKENPAGDVTSDNLAYVIYTSGSTGTPKGVLVPHRSLVNHSLAIAALYELQPTDRILQFASFNFDVAAEELFPSLASGAAVVLLREKALASLQVFSEFLLQKKITVVNLPASYWHHWVHALADSEAFLADTIRLVIAGSERVVPEDFNIWQKIGGGDVRWLNAYGLTETTITSLVFDPARSKTGSYLNSVPIGRPIDNTEVYLLDTNLQPVPIGIPGHLYIGGDCLSRGYLNHPELTASKFIAHPFDSSPDARLYNSGDVVRYLEDGEIEYLDRVDNQVKIRGYRIELGEIEAVLSAHPGLRDAAVVAKENGSGEMRLLAYVVPREAKNGDAPPIELWPSVGEYPVYDEMLYYSLSTDQPRTSRYETAIKQLVKGKTIVEIGTGKDAILARFCIAAGAKKVYAIEALDDAYRGAESLIESLGLSDKISLIKGFSFDVELPEKVDVCVSEIIGTIGSSEGVVPILNDARRFLKEKGRMIPERCLTKIAAVQLSEEVVEFPHFSELSGRYAEKVFEHVGSKFDVRVCLRNLPKENLLSDGDIFEDLDFNKFIDSEYSREILLTATKSGRFDGFLLWLNLHTTGDLVIDSLEEKTSWLPLYFPVFDPGIEVNAGDIIKAVCSSSICENGFNPDYRIKGSLLRQDGEVFEFEHNSAHHRPVFKQTPFYQKLFSPEKSYPLKSQSKDISSAGMRAYLSKLLPNYMVPGVFIEIDKLPSMINGKIDRKALPEPIDSGPQTKQGIVGHRNPLELKLVKIWESILDVHPIGVHDNFFDLGGQSLQAVRMFAEVESTFGKNIPLATLFEAGTIEKLADILRQDGWSAPESSLVPIQPDGTRPIFFCIHAKGGNVLFYRDLAKHMGSDQPFYGLQARRLGGRQVGHATVEEMAEFYIKEIRELQPDGPYYVGGSSFGGLAAFEIAQQLHRQGQKVALLALLDTGTPDYPKLLPGTTVFRSRLYEYVRRIQHHRDSLKAFNSEERIEYVLSKLKKVRMAYRRKINNTYKKTARKFFEKVKGVGSIPKNYIQIEDQIAKAGEKYLPKVYPGEMTLFRATSQPLGIQPDPTLGWNDFVAGGLTMHEVPGHHGSIVAEPYVRVLAEKLLECIDQATDATKSQPIL